MPKFVGLLLQKIDEITSAHIVPDRDADPIFAAINRWSELIVRFENLPPDITEDEYDAAWEKEFAAQEELFRTEPATIEGVIALASFLALEECAELCNTTPYNGSDVSFSTAMATIASSLQKIAAQQSAFGAAP
ncbi:hypothetical protein Msil_2791 [Methylocella silvestris BL2]|uniref:Uncharacterized protein n=1 Tax=Methylocella silvestris (strain DSM 15510 / CIP 108128 / LMG 27833 / NCIMB 13906 / BL2) TaxID=395965 RepID=B8ES12_METSB|nr:hypothetical protein [Methylocella silvestris]ACK51710.1 hypothetical protein Msil_2791 [Methylocella silvestris BL2]